MAYIGRHGWNSVRGDGTIPERAASRFVFIGRVVWLRVRDGIVDPHHWRVDYARFLPSVAFQSRLALMP